MQKHFIKRYTIKISFIKKFKSHHKYFISQVKINTIYTKRSKKSIFCTFDVVIKKLFHHAVAWTNTYQIAMFYVLSKVRHFVFHTFLLYRGLVHHHHWILNFTLSLISSLFIYIRKLLAHTRICCIYNVYILYTYILYIQYIRVWANSFLM